MARFGEIGKQYFDNAGDPLIKGKLKFEESGGGTDKDTFSDVNLSKKNSNPVLLTGAGRQPNIFFNGTARVILTKNDDTQLEVRDPEGGATGSGQFEAWNSLTIYNTADIVIASDDKYYRSFTDNNQANDPTTPSPTFWEEVEFIRIWNPSVSYALNATVKGSDGLFYRSLVADNLGNDPVTDGGTNWGPPIPVQPTDIPLIQAITLSL